MSVGCASYYSNTDEALFFIKLNEHESKNPKESNWFDFQVQAVFRKNTRALIDLKTLSTFCNRYPIPKNLELQNGLGSLYYEYPIFIIENEEGKYRFLLNRENDIGVVRKNLNECHIHSTFHNTKKRRYSGGVNELGVYRLYKNDLKINPTDKKVKLHYLYKNFRTSSNWINL